MSRRTVQEYTARTRRRYTQAGKAKRRVFLKEFTETTHFSRCYANKLLRGNRWYTASPGRGRGYDTETAGTLESIRREADGMNTKYLKATIGDWVRDYETRDAAITPGVREKILKTSASMMDRILRGKKRDNWAGAPSSRRPGRNGNNPRPLAVRRGDPGLHGGSGRRADRHVRARGLRPVRELLPDPDGRGPQDPVPRQGPVPEQGRARDAGGPQGYPDGVALHRHLPSFGQRGRVHQQAPAEGTAGAFSGRGAVALAPAQMQRQRPYRAKERGRGRNVFGGMRIDETDVGPALPDCARPRHATQIFSSPWKMLVSKRTREKGKGFECVYDNPKMPLRRLIESGTVDSKTAGDLLAAMSKTSGILLPGQIGGW